MKEKTDKILTLALLGLAIVTTVFAFVFALNTVNNNGMFDIAFWLLIAMIGVSLVAIVFFLCKKLFSRFKEERGYLRKFLILCGVIIVVLLASYLLSNGTDVSTAMLERGGLNESGSKLIGAACILVYIIVAGATLSIIVTELLPKSNKKK